MTTATTPWIIEYYNNPSNPYQSEFITSNCAYDVDGNLYVGLSDDYQYNNVIIKYNQNGDVIWKKSLGTGNGDPLFCPIIQYMTIRGGNLYVIYFTPVSSRQSYPWLLTKFDLNGNTVWSKTLTSYYYNYDSINNSDTTNNYYMLSPIIVDAYENIFLLFKRIIIFNDYNNSNNSYVDISSIIYKFDKNGNFIWEHIISDENIPAANLSSSANGFKLGPDGNLYVTSSGADSIGGGWNYLTKVDSITGNRVWIKSLSKFNWYIIDIAVTSQYIYILNNFTDGTISLTQFDRSGNINWSEQIILPSGTSTSLGAFCLFVDRSENLYFVNSNYNNSSVNYSQFDSNGNIVFQNSIITSNTTFYFRNYFYFSTLPVTTYGNSITFTMTGYSLSTDLYSYYCVFQLPTDGSKLGTYAGNYETYTIGADTMTTSTHSLTTTGINYPYTISNTISSPNFIVQPCYIDTRIGINFVG